MIITQKYHSALDIDPEFIPSLEKLLCDCVPSFEWIKNYETTSPKETHFTYYLFFGNKHNRPVGFAQIAIEQSSNNGTKESFIKKFFNKSKTDSKIKKANWQMPGSLNEGVIFEPMYSKLAIEKTENIFNEFSSRSDIQVQSLRFSKAYANLSNTVGFKSNLQNEKTIPDTLIKNQASYEDYLDSLSNEVKNDIKNNWKLIHKNNFKLGEYNKFKEVFAYRENGAATYKALKVNSKISKYIKEDSHFLTIETEESILAIIFFIKGNGHHSFYDFIKLNDSLDDLILNQYAIMKFYEKEDSNRLHLLMNKDNLELFKKQGFTTRDQIELSVVKSRS
jgi:hypothetical protein